MRRPLTHYTFLLLLLLALAFSLSGSILGLIAEVNGPKVRPATGRVAQGFSRARVALPDLVQAEALFEKFEIEQDCQTVELEESWRKVLPLAVTEPEVTVRWARALYFSPLAAGCKPVVAPEEVIAALEFAAQFAQDRPLTRAAISNMLLALGERSKALSLLTAALQYSEQAEIDQILKFATANFSFYELLNILPPRHQVVGQFFNINRQIISALQVQAKRLDRADDVLPEVKDRIDRIESLQLATIEAVDGAVVVNNRVLLRAVLDSLQGLQWYAVNDRVRASIDGALAELLNAQKVRSQVAVSGLHFRAEHTIVAEVIGVGTRLEQSLEPPQLRFTLSDRPTFIRFAVKPSCEVDALELRWNGSKIRSSSGVEVAVLEDSGLPNWQDLKTLTSDSRLFTVASYHHLIVKLPDEPLLRGNAEGLVLRIRINSAANDQIAGLASAGGVNLLGRCS